jgi:hypothetical protein
VKLVFGVTQSEAYVAIVAVCGATVKTVGMIELSDGSAIVAFQLPDTVGV